MSFCSHSLAFLEMMLQVDQNKRADIFQVANFAFDIVGRPCPVRNAQVSMTAWSFNMPNTHPKRWRTE